MNWNVLAHAEEIAAAITLIGGAVAGLYFAIKKRKGK